MKKWIEFGFFSGLGLYNLLLKFFAECYIKSKYVCVKKILFEPDIGFYRTCNVERPLSARN